MWRTVRTERQHARVRWGPTADPPPTYDFICMPQGSQLRSLSSPFITTRQLFSRSSFLPTTLTLVYPLAIATLFCSFPLAVALDTMMLPTGLAALATLLVLSPVLADRSHKHRHSKRMSLVQPLQPNHPAQPVQPVQAVQAVQPVKSQPVNAAAKTTALLTCLGSGPVARADRTRITPLVQAAPHHSDGVWLTLTPATWGFKLDANVADSWNPTVASDAALDSIASDRAKLMHCVKQENLGAPATAPASAPAASPQRAGGSGSSLGGSSGTGARKPVSATFDGTSIKAGGVSTAAGAAPAADFGAASDFAFDAQMDTPPSGAPAAPADPANPVNPAAPATPDAPATDGSSLAAPAAANAAAAGSTGASPGSEMSAGEAAVAIALEQAKGSAGMPLLGQNASDTTTTSTCTKIWTRKEYSTMTVEEKTQFANAFKCVRSKPSRFKSDPGWNAADDWTLLHIRMVKYVHFSAFFLVFHRGFSAIVERDLQECGFQLGLPWVDWTLTAEDPSTNAIFDGNPEYGLGTNGQGNSTNCPWKTGREVTDGALADHWFNAPFKHKLCRQFNNMDVKLPNAHFGSNCTTFISESFLKGLALTHNDGSFFDFSSAVEISLHLAMHTSAGGNLAWLSTSVNDPVFHPHHGHIDNLFSSWQDMNPKNKRAFHGPKKQQKDGAHPPWNAKRTDMINFAPLADSVAVEDLLDHTSGKWGGRMCYRYDRPIDLGSSS